MKSTGRAWLLATCALALLTPELSQAGQRIDALSPEVRKYVRVATPKTVLEHVHVIDGTGAAPRYDQDVVIEDGKILSIGSSATHSPSDSVTVLALPGYSLLRG